MLHSWALYYGFKAYSEIAIVEIFVKDLGMLKIEARLIYLHSGWSLSCKARQIPIAMKITLSVVNGILSSVSEEMVAIV